MIYFYCLLFFLIIINVGNFLRLTATLYDMTTGIGISMIVWYLLNQDNATPLIWAALGGHASSAKLLLDAKAAINYSNSVSHSSQQLQYLTF
jgi:ankyrin repeat protein